uniref:fimbria/pilus outer membrane usher protein n=1 Tax=Siccibacter colletis TaxID=1505757 RepID=UPI0036F1C129
MSGRELKLNRFNISKKNIIKTKHLLHRQRQHSRRVACSLFYSFLLIQRGWAAPVQVENPKTPAAPADVQYNEGFVHGVGINVAQYEKGNVVSPGVHTVTAIVNGENRGNHNINFAAESDSLSGIACFTNDDLSALGIIPAAGSTKGAQLVKGDACVPLNRVIPEARVIYNDGDFELNITVPQANLAAVPRGYIDPKRWESGETAGFVDYNANLYDASSDDNEENYSGNIGLLMGFNVGEWRLRKRINSNWVKGDDMHTQSLLGYAERDITAMRSRITLGDTNTPGELFDSYGMRGVQLQSDDRMLPEGLRNYAPILQGIAETNARVTVTQHGQKVYETVVPPGPFTLDDIGVMGYGGDMEMTITEADGRQRVQTIPFSAPPMLLHEGVSRFSASVGELHDDTVREKAKILQGVYYYGIGNNYTVYAGTQIAEHYKSAAVGNSINTPIGGLSFDITHAESDISDNKTTSGNSFSVGYTKYLDTTDTNMTLAAYRYSSEGFYTFRDATLARYGSNIDDDDVAVDYRTKQRFTANVSQQLWANSSLALSASLYDYWDSRETGKQYSVTFNKSQRYFSWSVTAMRTDDGEGEYDDSIMLGLNVPIGDSQSSHPLFSSIYSTATHDSDGRDTFQLNANGSRGEQSELTYGIGTAASGVHGSDGQETVSGNMNYRTPVGQFGMTASANNTSSRQISLSANGSLVAHRGGITPGAQLGDYPFAIIHAEGAEGAKVTNGYGAHIDGNGYAIMPSLTPYRENTVMVDTKGLPSDVDVMENQKVVVPRLGAALSVEMKTLVGKPIIIIARNEHHDFLPIGTTLVDDKNVTQSIIGQGGMAFIRGWDPLTQSLFAVLNAGKTRCRLVNSSTRASLLSAEMTTIEQREMTCIQ